MSKNVPITAQTPLPAPAPSPEELGPLVGKTFGGYEVASYIGEGATGAVYRAEDLMGQRMAVKVMHRELSRKEHADKLWADLQKLNASGDEHFVRVYDCGFGDDGEFYYTMDELAGVDLEAALEESGALAPKRAVEIMDQVCTAVIAAHEAGVVHGGLKPRNIFLHPTDGRLVIKVLDFGAARLAGGVDKGVIVGNPFYMAPEQFGGHADERTDVYSLGVLMYELFSGTLPFNGPTHGQVMMRHLAEPPASPPGVDAGLARIILKALQKAQHDRYPTVAALHEALEKWAAGARSLENAAAAQVIARATQARKVKQAALTTPDATAPMGKIDVAELANATRQQLEPAKHTRGSGNGMQTTTRKEENPNSSESVEASLEDFISQANATFPATDGWDLHTGDVELVDDGPDDEMKLEEEEHVSAPVVVKPRSAKAEAAAHTIKKADKSNRSKKAPAIMTPTPMPQPMAAAQPTAEGVGWQPPPQAMPEAEVSAKPARRNPFEAQIQIESQDEEENEDATEVAALDGSLDLPRAGRRRRERENTDVIDSPLRRAVPWTSNPVVWIAGVFAAFVCGAVLVFIMVKMMMPTQQPPVIVQAPAPQQPAAAPVVTSLAQPGASAPVVTSLAQPKAAEPAAPAAAAPLAQVDRSHHASAHHASSHSAPAPKLAAATPRKSSHAAASDDDDDDDAPAPKKAKSAKGSKGGDWVDPFAQ